MKLESLKMNLKSLKKQANNAKCLSIKAKSTKIVTAFIQNKANFVNFEIGVSSFETGKYEILTAWRAKKQTQFKANTNPIAETPKMNLNIYHTKEYDNETFFLAAKTNPIQTQILSSIPANLAFLLGSKPNLYPEYCLAIYIEKGYSKVYYITLKFRTAIYEINPGGKQ